MFQFSQSNLEIDFIKFLAWYISYSRKIIFDVSFNHVRLFGFARSNGGEC